MKPNPFEVIYILKYGNFTKEEISSIIRSNMDFFIKYGFLILDAIGVIALILSQVRKRGE